PWLAPYDPDEQLDPAAGSFRPPGTSLAAVRLADGNWRLADRVERIPQGLRIERLGRREVLPTGRVLNLTSDGVANRRFYLLGSDRFGRDLWSRMLWGGQISLLIGLFAAALALILGVAVGAAAALGRSWIDGLLMRLVDALLSFPLTLLLVALAVFFQPSTSGLHPFKVFWRHLLPNALTPVLVQTALLIGQVILSESSLSFLGLGVQPPT